MDKRFVIDHLINKRRKDENLAWDDEKKCHSDILFILINMNKYKR